MADIANPGWIALETQRVESAARAGADGLWIDNTFLYYSPLNLVFTGDTAPSSPSWPLTEMLRAVGERPLGIEAAQLIATAQWAQKSWRSSEVRLERSGMRSQVEAVTAAALEPSLFHQVVSHGGIHSLRYLLDKPVDYRTAPDLFCLDLYKYFDLGPLAAIAAPTSIIQRGDVELQTKP